MKAVRLNATKEQPLRVIPELLESGDAGFVALRLEGPKITRVALFDLKSGKWWPLDLDEPADGAVGPIDLAPDAAAYEVGRFYYVFNSKTCAWNRVDLQAIADDKQDAAATKRR